MEILNRLQRYDRQLFARVFKQGERRQDLFDMDCFGEFEYCRGLTFCTRSGRIRPFASLVTNNLAEFARDVRALKLDGFDAVVSDFEPVTAWAGRRGEQVLVYLPLEDQDRVSEILQRLPHRAFVQYAPGLGRKGIYGNV